MRLNPTISIHQEDNIAADDQDTRQHYINWTKAVLREEGIKAAAEDKGREEILSQIKTMVSQGLIAQEAYQALQSAQRKHSKK